MTMPDELQGWIDRLRELGELPKTLAPKVAEALRVEVAANIAAGVGPDGVPWPPTKDGRKPLAGAANALRASAVGSVAILALEGPEVLHHEGRAKGGVKRPILPGRKLNAPALRAVQKVLIEGFRKAVAGG